MTHLHQSGPFGDRTRLLFVMATTHEYLTELSARIEPLITGVGPIESAISVTRRLAELAAAGRPPSGVVCLGSAGSRRKEVGTVWQVSSVSWRDMDATALGFEKGVTPFSDHPAIIELPTPLADVPRATLSTGADVVSGPAYDRVDADLVDMETFAVVRACRTFGVPVMGIRAVSDGPGELGKLEDWTALLGTLDERLAAIVDRITAEERARAAAKAARSSRPRSWPACGGR